MFSKMYHYKFDLVNHLLESIINWIDFSKWLADQITVDSIKSYTDQIRAAIRFTNHVYQIRVNSISNDC